MSREDLISEINKLILMKRTTHFSIHTKTPLILFVRSFIAFVITYSMVFLVFYFELPSPFEPISIYILFISMAFFWGLIIDSVIYILLISCYKRISILTRIKRG